MKTTKAALAAVAVAFVAAAFHPGIAQAAGNQTELALLGFTTPPAPEQGDSSGPYVESRPVLNFHDEDAYRTARSPAEGMELQNPVETGRLPSSSEPTPPVIEAGGLEYRVGIDTGP